MKKYMSFLRMRMVYSLQYRAAALAGISTQFAWGAMTLLMYAAFYRANAAAFPMAFEQLASYVWLQQAFFALFDLWRWDRDIMEAVSTGQVAYELIRPASVYGMWYVKTAAVRIANAALRCMPILVVACFLSAPYGLSLPQSPQAFCLFVLGMAAGVGLSCAVMMLLYTATFYMVNASGLRMLMGSVGELLMGGIIPLSFFPDGVREVLMALPLGQIRDLPLRIYNGQLAGGAAVGALGLQCAWLAVLLLLGQYALGRALRRTVAQGG